MRLPRQAECEAIEWTGSFQDSEQYVGCTGIRRPGKFYCWTHAYLETVDELATHYGIDKDYDEPGCRDENEQLELFNGEEYRRG